MQKNVLRKVLHYIQHVEEHGNEYAKACLRGRTSGVPIRWLRGYGHDRRRSDSAAFSRALNRLEQRGLIVRTNTVTGLPPGHPRAGYVRQAAEEPHKRTNAIILTDAGREEAEYLSVNIITEEIVNR